MIPYGGGEMYLWVNGYPIKKVISDIIPPVKIAVFLFLFLCIY
jgi:hypothetical protein